MTKPRKSPSSFFTPGVPLRGDLLPLSDHLLGEDTHAFGTDIQFLGRYNNLSNNSPELCLILGRTNSSLHDITYLGVTYRNGEFGPGFYIAPEYVLPFAVNRMQRICKVIELIGMFEDE